MRTKSHKDYKVNVVTLGCSKNLVDSEEIISQLKSNDLEVVHESGDDDADVVIVNTCGFIERAKEESIQTILQFADAKREGDIEKLYVTGCLSQRYKNELEEEIPEVDRYFGTMELPLLLEEMEADYKKDLIGQRSLTTPSHYAYLKISEGCNRTCSFCAIPLMRGKHKSKPIETIVLEAEGMVASGVKEIMLIAQELTFYGLDLYRKRMLPKLLDQLAAVKGLKWIRLHYAYPSQFPIEIFDAIAKHKNICNYLDMPLQHASDAVLKRMRRNINLQKTEDLINLARERVLGIAIRTTMLVGFPGETQEDFESLIEFVKRAQFDRLGVFTYSHEEGTHGYQLVDDVPEDLKQERANQLMEVQREISMTSNQKLVGQELDVLIDRIEGRYLVGRTEYDSPEVDNEVLIKKQDEQFQIGQFYKARIISATDYDLEAEIV